MAEVITVTISVIIPAYNCEPFIEEALNSVLNQQLSLNEKEEEQSESSGVELRVEISLYEDASTDGTLRLIQKAMDGTAGNGKFSFILSRNETGTPKGVGFGRNQAIAQSSGEYLCFFDADDVMEPTRIREQYKAALQYPDALIGSGFRRIPSDSTPILTKWGNSLTERQLYAQIYTSFGPTLAMPTWFCGRSVYLRVAGGFDERGKGIPEDLIFFYQHLDGGGTLFRVPEPLLLYRFHAGATTHSVSDATIYQLRLKRLEEKVLSGWSSFTIWNAGKAGRKLFRSLSPESREKVAAFCDVDEKKLELGFYSPHPLLYKIPIKHPSKGTKPFIIAVKIELSWDENGAFRKILDSLSLTEGEDYFYFN